jgi:KipI family sensor histidine kinase inhibitor
MRILPMGDHAVLVEDPPGGPAAWSRGVRAHRIDGVVDVVPAARTVLVRWAAGASGELMLEALRSLRPVGDGIDVQEVVIPVRYDGPDLSAVADDTGLSEDQVVALHIGAAYEVAFCGFAPGFGYLTGLPRPLQLPRRATPRTVVPAGSVAIAAGYAAVYPGASPGGWHLLGSTDLVLFDPDRDPPALLTPGTRVRFEPS